ncbi:ATP-binding protein [Butyrivibrio proteoclasticus]|uniref:ATP-binding protein n=1 Tax=Butyrivibrio proteoclasticus TaxID=43305 RepID=UPI00047CCA12|nr:ATP-binding protein [Butyrivibrio proteoclasticus]
MYREIINDLKKWKDKSRRKPLLLTGVRQCGKTYIIDEFAKKCFDSYVYVNFESSENLLAVFEYDYDVKRIVTELERHFRTNIIPGKTLVFFDEIQECPRAITALKYFCENMKELHLVCAGSLLGVALKEKNISFPVGKVNRLQLYPMSFKEFVIANDREDLIEAFNDWPTDRVIPDLYSKPMEKLLKEYYVVGGMPEVVKTWIETHDFAEVEEAQNEILSDYADDFSKHAPLAEVPKIRWIWDSVPVQLAKENNKFVFSHVKEGKRSAELEDALCWLSDAGLITKTELVEKPELPLSGAADKTYFKVYMSDIGLLRAKSKVSVQAIIDETEGYIRYKGAFAENYVLNELKSLGKEPYFWRSGNSAEIDFLFETNGEIFPVEVKSADNTQAKSYKQYCKKYKTRKGFKLSRKNIALNLCEEAETLSLPLYLGWNIDAYL